MDSSKFDEMYKFRQVILETKDENDQIVDITNCSYFTYIYSQILANRMMEQLQKANSNRIKVYEYNSRIIGNFVAVLNCFTSIRSRDVLRENPYEILAAAQSYQSKTVKEACLVAILEAVSPENVLHSLSIFSQVTNIHYNTPCMLSCCIKVISW